MNEFNDWGLYEERKDLGLQTQTEHSPARALTCKCLCKKLSVFAYSFLILFPHSALFRKQDFIQSQGRRAKLRLEFRASFDNIFSGLSKSFTEGNISPNSDVAADIVSVGDSWLSLTIRNGLIEALQGVEEHSWFRGLDDRWKVRIQSDLYGPFLYTKPWYVYLFERWKSY